MAYGGSNGDMIDTVTWPERSNSWLQYA